MPSSAMAAVRHAAALLGQVTHTANNHKVLVTRPDGTQLERVIRDSQPKEGAARSTRPSNKLPPTLPPPPAEVPQHCPSSFLEGFDDDEDDLGEKRAPCRRGVVARSVAKRRKTQEEAHVHRRVEEIASACQRSSVVGSEHIPTASERLSVVRQRILARLAREAA